MTVFLSSPHVDGQLPGVRPILISGVYRSGTTFLTAVLNRIPSISAASTVKYLRFCLPHHKDLDDPVALDRLLQETATRISVRWNLKLDLVGVMEKLINRPKNHATVCDAIMSTLMLDGGETRWAEKLAMQWRDIPTFLEMFPDGQVIHIFRDPRDVTSSYKKLTYEPWPAFMDASLNCKAAMTEVPKLREQHGADRILILRAEDMAHDLAGQMRIICDFLQEPFRPEFAELSTYGEIKGDSWRTNTSFDEASDNYTKAQPRWREALTPEELFLVELFCQPEMQAFGYVGSGQDIKTLDGVRLSEILSDEWFSSRVTTYLHTGRPEQGYRSDPYKTEMDVVFGATRK